jgi:hypothetical protein
MKFVKTVILFIATTLSTLGFANTNPDFKFSELSSLTNYYIQAVKKIQNGYVSDGDSSFELVTGGMTLPAYPDDKDIDFRNFLNMCLRGGAKQHVDAIRRMLKLIKSDQPWQVLDSVSYSAHIPIFIGDDIVSCNDAYQTIKANYWQRFRTHKAMSEFVSKYVADVERLEAYLAEHNKKEPKDDSAN